MIGNRTIIPNINEINFNNGKLTHSPHVKFLGLIVDSQMTWSEHIDALRRKIAGPVGVLDRLSYTLPKHLLRSVYFALIHSHIQYLSVIWNNPYQNLTKTITILQKKAIKIYIHCHIVIILLICTTITE